MVTKRAFPGVAMSLDGRGSPLIVPPMRNLTLHARLREACSLARV
jgi:hypothetical protein